MDITVTNLTIDDITRAIRNELKTYFADKEETEREDEIGGIALAIEVTGLAKPTIYGLVSERKIPHSKRGKKLYFSRKELLIWLTNGKRKTQDEIAEEAANFDITRKLSSDRPGIVLYLLRADARRQSQRSRNFRLFAAESRGDRQRRGRRRANADCRICQ